MSITSRINEMSSHIEQAYDELQGLGADLTNVDKNIENISMVLDDIYDNLPSVSGEGTSLTLDDTRVGKIKSTLKGNTSQTGTPTPSSPIPVNVVSGDNEINVCGKNLLNPNTDIINIYYNSSTKQFQYNANNRSIVVPIKPNTTYTVSRTEGYGNDFSIATSENYPTSGEYATNISVKWSTSILTNTITSGANDNYLLFYFGYQTSESTSREWLSKTQLEVGDQTTDFEPYQGNTYNIDLPVENLAELENGSLWDSNGAERDLDNSVRTKFISFESGMTITPKIFTSLTTRYLQYVLYDSSKVFISLNNFVDGTAITTSNTSVKYIRFKMTGPVNGSMTIDDINFMVVKGDKVPNSYTPYGTTPIELCKIGNYQDYFYKDSGKWYLHKEIGKVVLNGSTNRFTQIFSTDTSGINRYRTNEMPVKLQPSGQIANVYCNKLLPKTLVNTYSRVQGISVSDAITMFIIYIDDISTYTLEQANNWLSTNNLKIYYDLATPTNIEVEYQPLIDQLNAIEKAMSKNGQTNIMQNNNDLPFIISASALKEWSV